MSNNPPLPRLTRRHLGRLALGSAAATALPSTAFAKTAPPAPAGAHSFPAGFLWGAATAAYQVEGAATADGRGQSIWDTFSHTLGRVDNNSTGDIAVDEYHRYPEDIALLKDLGVKTYRFSVSWTRIFPNGSGQPNSKGVDYYRRLASALLAAGIEPYCTLYHWDLPQALQDKGGWQNRDTAQHFADYAAYTSSQLAGAGITNFMTVNELRTFCELGYKTGIHAPGIKLGPREFAQVNHHAVLAHGLGVQAIRAHTPHNIRIGFADNPIATTPVIADEANIAAAQQAFREENAQYLTVVMEGRYTDRYLQTLGAEAPRFTDADMKIISTPIDFLGLNIYQPTYVVPDAKKGYTVVPQAATFPRMLSDWLTIGPESLYWAPTLAAKLWNLKAIYITENGASAIDQPTATGEVMDVERVMYLRNYLSQLQKAVADGAPVKGYFVWSLLDNYEWADGYNKRFGLVHVDFTTQKRTPKLSASFYRSVIRENRAL